MDQTELQSPEVNIRKINLGTIKIQLLGVIGTVKLINKIDNNETTQYILRQLQGLTDIIQQDLHIIDITGELPEQHTDRFIEENQEPDLSQYNLATSQDSRAHTINEIKQTIIMIYFIKEKTPLQERLEGYLEQERKNYPELDKYIKNKEWNNQQYDLSSSTAKIITETNQSELWTNFDTYEEYIAQTKKQSAAQILKAKEYFAKELIRIIVKNWKYEYPRKQFEETEDNIADLMIREPKNFELSDLKNRIRLAKNGNLQLYLSIIRAKYLRKTDQFLTKEEIGKQIVRKKQLKPFDITNQTTSRIFGRKNIQWKDTTIENEIYISEQAEKYKELREKMNIFDKPSKEGILKTLNQDSFTYISSYTTTRKIQQN
ncbi:2710_t:CDS:2 [Gigaspora margarita]|uniref:2710_t:CDS:1 n=1 Tax=Gigaspora margarita TaxID=4874 RepID=A0ABN7VKY6_GIGMA|nr:2710_t:CDS:2 [Gigaspora margarita]